MPASPVRTAVAFVGALLVVATGCGGGGETSTVRGKVTFEGKPVVWGTVTLLDPSGQFHQAPIGLDGTYTIEKVPVGTVQVGVFSSKPSADVPKEVAPPLSPAPGGIEDPRAKFKKANPAAAAIPKPPEGAWFALPDRFADPALSGLTGDIQPGTTTLDLELR